MSVECGVGSGYPSLWASPPVSVDAHYPEHFDYGTFGLDFAVVNVCGPERSAFRLPTADESESLVHVGTEIFAAGYAAETNDGGILFHAKGTIKTVEPAEFQYELDTEKGMSGGPVWTNVGSEHVVIGVHVKEGGAKRLAKDALADIAKWTAQRQLQCHKDEQSPPTPN